MGNQLLQNREYEKALKSFRYYSDIGYSEMRWQALERQAEVWLSWAKYVEDYDLIPVIERSMYTEQAKNFSTRYFQKLLIIKIVQMCTFAWLNCT